MKNKRFLMCSVLIVYTLMFLHACTSDGTKRVSFVCSEAENYTDHYVVAIEKGKSISDYAFVVPEPYRIGYSFDGWALNGKPFSEETVINKNCTVKALWKKHEIKILPSDGGGAEVETIEKWTDMGTRYKLNYTTNEGFYLSKWLIQYDGKELDSSYDEDLFIILNSYATSCEITPVFTDKIIPVKFDINTYGGDGADGGTVKYPEFSTGERNFHIQIEAAEGYYILNYGFMQKDSNIPNLVNYIVHGFISPFETHSLTAQMHFRDTEFGPGEEKWFFVNFVEKTRAQVVRALMIEDSSTYSISVKVVMIGNLYEATAWERDGSTFLYWRDSEGNILSYNSTYSYTVTDFGERTIYAIYDKR